jgi:hypothetical protein
VCGLTIEWSGMSGQNLTWHLAHLQSPPRNDCVQNFSCRHAVEGCENNCPVLECAVSFRPTVHVHDGSAPCSGTAFGVRGVGANKADRLGKWRARARTHTHTHIHIHVTVNVCNSGISWNNGFHTLPVTYSYGINTYIRTNAGLRLHLATASAVQCQRLRKMH